MKTLKTDTEFQAHILRINNDSLTSQLESSKRIIAIQQKQLDRLEEFIMKLEGKS